MLKLTQVKRIAESTKVCRICSSIFAVARYHKMKCTEYLRTSTVAHNGSLGGGGVGGKVRGCSAGELLAILRAYIK
jgi:hypothetical protein